jgi:monoamine oxidase
MGAFAGRVAAELGESVHLGTPVRSVTQRDDRVVVESERVQVTAPFVVVTVPPLLVLDIEFDPPLPDERRTLYQRAVAGAETKTLLVYDRAFWRDDDLSGQSAHPHSASEVTIDSSPGDGSRGVLASFAFGHVARRLDALPADERRRLLLDTLSERFGPLAGSPLDVAETSWFTEPWSRGCSVAHVPPGYMVPYGRLLRAPFGRVRWAGTETATVSHGAVDGAVRSGERVAAELLAGMSATRSGAASP